MKRAALWLFSAFSRYLSLTLNSWALKSWELEILSSSGWVRIVTGCLDRICERTEKERPLRKSGRGWEGRRNGENGWRKVEMEKEDVPALLKPEGQASTYRKEGCQWHPYCHDNQAHGYMSPLCLGKHRWSLSPEYPLIQFAFSKHMWECQVLISSPCGVNSK